MGRINSCVVGYEMLNANVKLSDEGNFVLVVVFVL